MMTPKGPSRCHGVCMGTKFGSYHYLTFPIIFTLSTRKRLWEEEQRTMRYETKIPKECNAIPELARVSKWVLCGCLASFASLA
jgi:hypothetical protein